MDDCSINLDLYGVSTSLKGNKSYDVLNSNDLDDKSSIFSANNTSTNSISENVDLLNEAFEDVQDEQGIIGQIWNGFKNLTNLGLSSDDVSEKIEQYKKGEITFEEANEAIESYKNKQEGAVSIISNTATGLTTAGFAIATGGVGALVAGAIIGGVTNAGLKTLDRATNNIENDALDVKEIAKDGITGAVDGLVSAATAGIVKAPIAGQAVKQALKQGVVQGAKAGAITGAATGAADYTINTVADEKEFKVSDLIATTAQNALSGAAFGGLFGGLSNSLGQYQLNNAASEVKFKISHNKNLDAQIDNEAQVKSYIDNYNKNNPSKAIIEDDIYSLKTDELIDLSQKSEVLAKKFDSQLDETALQINDAFSNNDDIKIITARSKSQKSTFSKLAKKNLANGEVLDSMEKCSNAIGDAIGTRIQMKSLDKKETREIVESMLKESGVSATYKDFVKYIKGDKISDEKELVLSTLKEDILGALKEKQAQSTVDQLCEGIKKGTVNITELNNYGDEITSYFSNKQVTEILEAYNEAVINKVFNSDEPFSVVTNSNMFDLQENEILPNNKVKWVKKSSDDTEVEFIQKTGSAIKESGYTSAQMNTKHTLNNGEIVNGELQIRGSEVNSFADVEHVPYDIVTGKITEADTQYSEIYDLIKGMDPETYKKYNEYLSETYKTLRMKELGLLSKNYSLPKITDYIKAGVSRNNLSKIDIDGLIALSKK